MATAVGWLGGPPAPAVEGLQGSHEPVGRPDHTSNGHLKQHKGGSEHSFLTTLSTIHSPGDTSNYPGAWANDKPGPDKASVP